MSLETLPGTRPGILTEKEYETWCSGSRLRVEYVDGTIVVIGPVSLVEDRLCLFLSRLLGVFLDYRPLGEVLAVEYPIRLGPRLRRVPDVRYVANESRQRLGRTYLEGAPDAVWEVVSEDSVSRDWREKYAEYRDAGVSEYWIIDPAHRTVRLYRLEGGDYAAVEQEEGRLVSAVIPGFWLRPEWLWQDPLPRTLDCLREMGLPE